MKHIGKHIDYGWIMAWLLSLLAVLPMLNGDRIARTADGPLHVHRIQAMTTLLANGVLYPRWIPWFHAGYGYPIFNFYPPAATYLGGVLGLLGISAPLAFSLVMAGATMLGSVGMYMLMRRYFPAEVGIIAAALWVCAPSAMNGIWNQGSLPQILASGIVPWLFWASSGVIQSPNYRRSAWLALWLGMLILSHQPITLLTTLFLVPSVLVELIWQASHNRQLPWRVGYHLVLGGVLGVGMAAIFLGPMAWQMDKIVIKAKAAHADKEVLAHFSDPAELFRQPMPLDWTDVSWHVPITYGLVPALLAIGGLLALVRQKRYLLAAGLAAGVAGSVYLLTAISIDFWLDMPLMAQLRFPWRVMRVGVIFVAALGGLSILLVPLRWRSVATSLWLVGIIASALPTLYPSPHMLDYSQLQSADVIGWEKATGAYGTASYNEFKPIWGKRVPTQPPPDRQRINDQPMQIDVIPPTASDVAIKRLGDATFEVTTPDPIRLQFRQFYFTGWTATLNGHATPLLATEEYGLLAVELPRGTHIVALTYSGTQVDHIATWVSLVSVCLIGVLWVKGKSAPQPPVIADSALSPRLGWRIGGGVLVFALVNTYIIAPHTTWFRHYSPPRQPAAMQTSVHQSFSAGYELLGYTLATSTVEHDNVLNITLYWRALAPTKQGYRARVTLMNWQQNIVWASSEPFFIGVNPVEHQPHQFVSEQHRLALRGDVPPYVGRLVIELIDNATGEIVPTSDGLQQIVLDDVIHIESPNPTIRETTAYMINEQIELRCMAINRQASTITLTFYWQVKKSLPHADVRVFIHLLDADGHLINQADAPPLGGGYPAHLWRRGQLLVDRYVVPDNTAIETVFFGMYTPDGVRLPITRHGEPIADNGIRLPVENQQCAVD